MDRSARVAQMQDLEARTLLAAGLGVSVTSSTVGNVLNIAGTNRDDRIFVTNTPNGLLITDGGGWSTTYRESIALIRVDARAGNDIVRIDANIRTDTALYGGSGVDTLVGGSGSDRLYGGDGRDYLYGMAGNDVLVTIGDGSVDRCYGGEGFDSFWTDSGPDELIVDASPQELSRGAVHRITSFMSPRFSDTSVTYEMSMRLVGQDLPDPTLAGFSDGYRNFSGRPLFSRLGPIADDIYQGMLGDCYLLASLGSVAKSDPQAIRDRVVDLGDGTYAVQFSSGSTTTYVRVDADLPVLSAGLSYAGFGRQGSMWVAIMEKAYAFFRYNVGSYSSIASGFMGDVYEHLGLRTTSLFTATSGTALLQRLEADLLNGRAVTFGTRPDVGEVPCTGGHAYMVDAVMRDGGGQITGVRLRNPWGQDDRPGHGANDGYIFLTATQALCVFWFACSAAVR